MKQEIQPHELETCLEVMQRIADSHGTIPRSDRFNSLISKIYREGRRFDRIAEQKKIDDQDRALKASTAMVHIQRDAVAPAQALLAAPGGESHRRLIEPETCYICKTDYHDVHFFYHLLCPRCAAFNFQMRELRADLRGRIAMVTGGRVKIGHQVVLKLLRDGARVIVTTRFPHAAARRLHAEPDAAQWMDRLQVYGLDLRNPMAVEAFAQHLIQTEPHLDILIHNAAQTIRRPEGFYTALAAEEQGGLAALPLEARMLVGKAELPLAMEVAAGSSNLPAVQDVLPLGLAFADHEERADTRTTNSWMMRLDEVSAPEMLEVQLINAVAPFLLNSRLKPLMMKSPHPRRFIVNVSAMEGQFSRHKTVFHPHTNMAKASLNMMTRTAGEDYAKDGIYMTSVDTGWVTDENPTMKRERGQEERAFFAPLDIVDGMARIYHPVAHGLGEEQKPYFGVFLKDYAPCPW